MIGVRVIGGVLCLLAVATACVSPAPVKAPPEPGRASATAATGTTAPPRSGLRDRLLTAADLPAGYSEFAVPNTADAFTEGCPQLKQEFPHTDHVIVTFVGELGSSIIETLSTASPEVAGDQVSGVAELPQRCSRFSVDIAGIKGEMTSAAAPVPALGERRGATRFTMVVPELGSMVGMHMFLVAVSAGSTLMMLTVAGMNPIDAKVVDSLAKLAWEKAAR